MNPRILNLVFILFLLPFFASAEEVRIILKGEKKDLDPIAVTLIENVKKAGSFTFSTVEDTKGTANTITLAIDTKLSPSLGSQGFSIEGNKNSLQITALHKNGLQNGVYYYLRTLGFRFYLPGDTWTIIPSLNSVFKSVSIKKIPAFKNRQVFGTGGWPTNAVLDKDNTVKQLWEQWFDSNIWGYEDYIGGHVGESFNKKYKVELEKHPDWLAQVNGVRKWSQSAKLCISNPQARNLFMQDRVEEYKRIIARYPERNVISVEPADGGGHCTCPKCLKMGSVSDRVFFLANETAKELRKEDPKAMVSLYAYSYHVLPPTSKVEDNVMVYVVPYTYQDVLAPEVLIELWKDKAKNLGIYDYLGVTDGSKDLPRYNYPVYIPQKFNYWKQKNIVGYSIESGYAKFATGPALYAGSWMAWENKEFEEIMNEFFTDCFKEAAPIIKEMMYRWADNFSLPEEIDRSYEDIALARKRSRNESVQKRLDELALYVRYAELYNSYVSAAKGSAQRTKNAEQLMQYIWQVHPFGLINSSRIHQFQVLRIEANPGLTEKWSLSNLAKNKAFWESQFSGKNNVVKVPEVKSEVTNNLLDKPSTTYKETGTTKAEQVKTNAGKRPINLEVYSNVYFKLRANEQGKFNISIAFNGKSEFRTISLYDEHKNFLKWKDLSKAASHKELTFDRLIPNKEYYILIKSNKELFNVSVVANELMFEPSNVNNKGVRVKNADVYIYINKKVNALAFDAGEFRGSFYSPDNKLLFDVKKEYKGRQNDNEMDNDNFKGFKISGIKEYEFLKVTSLKSGSGYSLGFKLKNVSNVVVVR